MPTSLGSQAPTLLFLNQPLGWKGSLGTDVTGQPSHVRQLPCLPVGPVAFGKMIMYSKREGYSITTHGEGPGPLSQHHDTQVLVCRGSLIPSQ